MQIIRDMLLGALTWTIAIFLFVITIATAQSLYGPPISDRDRQLTFVLGGGATFLFAIFIIVVVMLIVKSK
jgi:hypothetical protein